MSGPSNLKEALDFLKSGWSGESVKENLAEFSPQKRERLSRRIRTYFMQMKRALSAVDWKGLTPQDVATMPSLWWEGSDGWEMLPDVDGLAEYARDLIRWCKSYTQKRSTK
jgi:hypothetical protein